MKRETRQIKTQARYIRIIILFVYTHCPFRWTVVIVKFKPVVKFVFVFATPRGWLSKERRYI